METISFSSEEFTETWRIADTSGIELSLIRELDIPALPNSFLDSLLIFNELSLEEFAQKVESSLVVAPVGVEFKFLSIE